MEDKKGPAFPLTRRDALRTLAALTGAVALSSLPNHWQRPAVAVGSLPAMAQNLSGVHIKDDTLQVSGEYVYSGSQDEANDSWHEVRIQFDYINAVRGVALMDVIFDWDIQSGNDRPDPSIIGSRHMVVNNPGGTPGHIDHTIQHVVPGTFFARVSIFIQDGSGLCSNTVMDTLTVVLP